MFEFTGKRYVVTGAASGIGQAVAEQLLGAGAEVTSLDRNTPKALVSRHIEVDLANPNSIDAALESLVGLYDGLINVAGIPGTAPADLVFSVNSLAVRHLTEAFFERLVAGGSVTIVSSTAGFGWPERLESIRDLLATDTFEEGAKWFKDHPQDGNAYNFSKEVTTVYTMSMGLAMAQMGLRINAVLPGPVETPILADFEESMGKDTLDGLKELLGRHANPSDIAEAVLFLASDAARWINGQALSVDGGISGAVATGVVPTPDF
ncbi:3-alpha-hydroxysteroid dehydrogenase [Mycobacteroides abscessus subsp. bolletii]|uniref:3-alpha-hydroxysteroid dehydrogenase n=1 Tax=Mycobacteroides abscessus subsp. bolletii TaxID=319705 RepID=A0A9Q7SHN0_9MYCO|nr:coniferyl-alcohol dehydrogenase [Mycobacteroides abscessus]MDO2968782.1 coniferyl-alcohol dehydrogenase [Mycobacteroides abscessus subsp. bolletii]MDO3078788.1 coniferyl-alcohol dehydrogenase [Mycobacteroides abscessus subsp. bolletii]MDO3126639.1 coniferyl-alcohol dehydrogenase [Mycobacteroides abscessus subsp. bolletii]ORA29717.1 3-alpha-hydroxysteroid dehydrogenase [Mycobacteroides abscessus subsp. bolletii]TPF65688.1 3-alpha-hydroxysteroid dehydrogenase [Mycobacteroides abscessus subsp.